MRFTVASKPITEEKDALLAIASVSAEKKDTVPPLGASAEALDDATDGAVRSAFTSGAFGASAGEVHTIPGPHGTTVLMVGLGKPEKLTLEGYRKAGAAAIKKGNQLKGARLVSAIHEVESVDQPLEARAEAVAVGTVLGTYRFERFKGKGEADEDKPDPHPVKTVHFVTADAAGTRAVKKAVEAGEAVGLAQCSARDFGNTPGNVATPRYFADAAKKMGRKLGLKVSVLTETEMKKHKMGGILGVAQGSNEKPRMVVFEHKPKGSRGRPYKTVAVVGKGITFDSGGISLKPGPGMELMKYDKAGACAVYGIMEAVARLDLPLHVIGIAGFAENMPSGTAQRPGDIVTMANGKTVEILNTDAEGRMVLGDALWLAHKHKPDAIVDLATLTGAVDVALGKHYCGLMGSDDDLVALLRDAGEASGERMWQLPLGDEYQEQIKGTHADLNNIGGRSGGSITAGQFLRNFVEEDKAAWAHMDIASVAWVDSNEPTCPKGCTGFGVRGVTTFLRSLSG